MSTPHAPSTPARLSADLRAEIAAIADDVGCALLHVGFQGSTLQIVLDRDDGGVTIDHCTSVSRQLSPLLDAHEFGKKRYTLEVTSPGIDRLFYSRDDYARFCGEQVRITFRDPQQGSKRTLVARLSHFHDGTADGTADRIILEPSDGAAPIVLPLEAVEQTRIEVDWSNLRSPQSVEP
ncbi:MAG: ribosome maturation factor RimP [Acidobacteriota bacterium]